MVDPILVGMELSGRFVEIVIDLMEKYPDEWSIQAKSEKSNPYNSLPALTHTGGAVVQLWSKSVNGNVISTVSEEDMEAGFTHPAQLPLNENAGKKLGGACVKLYKYLILKSLGYERLLKEGNTE